MSAQDKTVNENEFNQKGRGLVSVGGLRCSGGARESERSESILQDVGERPEGSISRNGRKGARRRYS